MHEDLADGRPDMVLKFRYNAVEVRPSPYLPRKQVKRLADFIEIRTTNPDLLVGSGIGGGKNWLSTKLPNQQSEENKVKEVDG